MLFLPMYRVKNSSKEWASYQIRRTVGCACAGNAGNDFPATLVCDPDMHHGTCVMHAGIAN